MSLSQDVLSYLKNVENLLDDPNLPEDQKRLLLTNAWTELKGTEVNLCNAKESSFAMETLVLKSDLEDLERFIGVLGNRRAVLALSELLKNPYGCHVIGTNSFLFSSFSTFVREYVVETFGIVF